MPILRAAGAKVLVDFEHFDAGRKVVGQMDDLQKNSDRHLLIITKNYLESEYCRHEMMTAILTDPDFSKGKVLPVLLDGSHLPSELSGSSNTSSEIIYRTARNQSPGRYF